MIDKMNDSQVAILWIVSLISTVIGWYVLVYIPEYNWIACIPCILGLITFLGTTCVLFIKLIDGLLDERNDKSVSK